MGLSEREQRILDEIEQAWHAEGAPEIGEPGRKRLIGGTLLTCAGLALLLGAVIIPLTPLGVVGFLVMLTGTTVALRGYKYVRLSLTKRNDA